MKKIAYFIILTLIVSCGNQNHSTEGLEVGFLKNDSTYELVNLDGVVKFKKDEFNWLKHELEKNIAIEEISYSDFSEMGCSQQLSADEKYNLLTFYIGAIIERESAYNEFEVTGENIGLMQMSILDAKNHSEDLYDNVDYNFLVNGRNNISIGILILKHQLNKTKRLFPSRLYFWEVLSRYKKDVLKMIKNNIKRNNFSC